MAQIYQERAVKQKSGGKDHFESCVVSRKPDNMLRR